MKIAKYLLICAALFLLAACASAPECSSAEIFCAGLVTDTLGVEDYGVNQDTWAGIQNALRDGTIDRADKIESVDARDYEKNLVYFAERGYDAIFTAGIGLQNETLRAAEKYPEAIFVGINQPVERVERRDNFISVTFQEDQMGFAAGVLAAKLTRANIVGAACEKSDLDAMWRYCEGFRAGAQFASHDIKILVAYHDEADDEKLFVDEEWGRKTAEGMIWRGADVIFAAGGITAQGALREATESGVKVIGAERDQAAALGEANTRVVTSIYGDAQFEAERILRGLRGGTAGGQVQTRIKFIPPGPKFPENLSPELAALLTDLGSLKIGTNVSARKP